jgi:hypothetical protein
MIRFDMERGPTAPLGSFQRRRDGDVRIQSSSQPTMTPGRDKWIELPRTAPTALECVCEPQPILGLAGLVLPTIRRTKSREQFRAGQEQDRIPGPIQLAIG